MTCFLNVVIGTHCLVEQTFFLLAAIFAFYMLKTYYIISFELVLQILGGLLPDIEPVYMSEKNSNHVKEIDDI